MRVIVFRATVRPPGFVSSPLVRGKRALLRLGRRATKRHHHCTLAGSGGEEVCVEARREAEVLFSQASWGRAGEPDLWCCQCCLGYTLCRLICDLLNIGLERPAVVRFMAPSTDIVIVDRGTRDADVASGAPRGCGCPSSREAVKEEVVRTSAPQGLHIAAGEGEGMRVLRRQRGPGNRHA